MSRVNLRDFRSKSENGYGQSPSDKVDAVTQTSSVSLSSTLKKFESEVRIIANMKDGYLDDALKMLRQMLKDNAHILEDTLKYQILMIECLLYQKRFEDAQFESYILFDLCTARMNAIELDISTIAFDCRENSEYTRAMLYYLCSLHCWVRDMRSGKIRKRTIEVINRGERFAVSLLYIGLQESKEIVLEYGIPVLRDVMTKYEIGPPNLSTHRDLSIMGCYFHLGETCKKLGELEKCIEVTKDGLNIGMKSIKEHKNYLLPKSHYLVADAYMALRDYENSIRWFESALALCPFITNWDFQSPNEGKKEFEKTINEHLKYLRPQVSE